MLPTCSYYFPAYAPLSVPPKYLLKQIPIIAAHTYLQSFNHLCIFAAVEPALPLHTLTPTVNQCCMYFTPIVFLSPKGKILMCISIIMSIYLYSLTLEDLGAFRESPVRPCSIFPPFLPPFCLITILCCH